MENIRSIFQFYLKAIALQTYEIYRNWIMQHIFHGILK